MTSNYISKLDNLKELVARLTGKSIQDVQLMYEDKFSLQVPADQDFIIEGIKDRTTPSKFVVLAGIEEVATFTLTAFPSNNHIFISTESHVDSKYRSQGIGTILNQIKREIYLYCGISVIMCSVNNGNDIQMRILKRDGWKKVEESGFFSVYCLNLNPVIHATS